MFLLPGGLCTAAFYDGLAEEPSLSSVRLVAATLPGYGGTEPLADMTIEGWARAAGELASEVGADVVVGHSIGANVALEMAALGLTSAPLVLLAPSFSREDEMKALGVLDGIGRVPGVGQAAWWAAMKAVPRASKSMFPPERADALAAAMQGNDPGVARQLMHAYLEYLDRHGSVVARLESSGARAWVVFGDHKEVGLADAERRALEANENVTLLTITDATHMMFTDQPAQIAELIAEALGGRVPSPPGGSA